jgi:hypothetical protein
VILIENEGGSRVENNDLGQGHESFVVEIGAVEEGVIDRERGRFDSRGRDLDIERRFGVGGRDLDRERGRVEGRE